MFPSRSSSCRQYTDIDIFISKILNKNVNCQTGLLVALLPPVQSIHSWQVVGEERLKCNDVSTAVKQVVGSAQFSSVQIEHVGLLN